MRSSWLASVVSILARIAFAFCFMHTNRYANMSDTGPCMHEEKLIAKGGHMRFLKSALSSFVAIHIST